MSPRRTSSVLGRRTTIAELSEKMGHVVGKSVLPLGVVVALESLNLLVSGKPGAGAFMLIGLGCIIALGIWKSAALGLPLFPLLVIQNLVIYGLPIAAHHDIILSYSSDDLFQAGREVLVFSLALSISWILGMQMFRPASGVSHVLHEFNKAGVKGWARLGFGLITFSTSFEVLQESKLADPMFALLPDGATSILFTLVAVVSACGFFLVSMMIGSDDASVVAKLTFWSLLVVNGMISASDFILSAAAANLITVAVGFFWSNGRVPWKYLTVSMLVLSFFNTGKTTMRERYWGSDFEPAQEVTLFSLPANYTEWAHVSLDAVLENSSSQTTNSNGDTETHKNQTLLDRIDNVQNLLFVIDAIGAEHIKPLNGQTYAIIPPLLVPRILWPDKPRSHEGQVILNVHFGRQDLNSTFATYIAWGLLPEAYGNFGPTTGALLLGLFLGLTFAWIENFTARKLVMSMEGFLSLSLMMNFMNSFEMVASVFVTAVFQSFVIVICACLPFVHRLAPIPPEEEAEDKDEGNPSR